VAKLRAVMQDPEPKLPPPDPDPEPLYPPIRPEPDPVEPGPDVMPQIDPTETPQFEFRNSRGLDGSGNEREPEPPKEP
jgi:hypothetical protein